MKYASEELRDKYHKASAMLQVICHMLELFFNEHGYQSSLTEVEEGRGYTYAVISCEAMTGRPEALSDAVERINKQFKRKDDQVTCRLANFDHAVFEVYLTNLTDLELVH